MERPILFKGPLVRAILEGRKTQTRRVVKPPPPAGHSWAGWCVTSTCAANEGKAVWARGTSPLLQEPHHVRCPCGQPGDRLWVRETWGTHSQGFDTAEESTFPVYRADTDRPEPKKWIPSIHMPRWACRLVLEITDVRVERLHAITEEDAIAEGSQEPSLVPITGARLTERGVFAALWASVYGRDSWDSNPWVWAITFRQAPQEIAE